MRLEVQGIQRLQAPRNLPRLLSLILSLRPCSNPSAVPTPQGEAQMPPAAPPPHHSCPLSVDTVFQPLDHLRFVPAFPSLYMLFSSARSCFPHLVPLSWISPHALQQSLRCHCLQEALSDHPLVERGASSGPPQFLLSASLLIAVTGWILVCLLL